MMQYEQEAQFITIEIRTSGTAVLEGDGALSAACCTIIERRGKARILEKKVY